jgi:hypothetical protein
MKVLHEVAEDSQLKNSKVKSVSFKQDEEPWGLNEYFSSFSIEFDPVKSASASGSQKIKLNLKSDEAEKLGKVNIPYKKMNATVENHPQTLIYRKPIVFGLFKWNV